jgi:hypothetical protein
MLLTGEGLGAFVREQPLASQPGAHAPLRRRRDAAARRTNIRTGAPHGGNATSTSWGARRFEIFCRTKASSSSRGAISAARCTGTRGRSRGRGRKGEKEAAAEGEAEAGAADLNLTLARRGNAEGRGTGPSIRDGFHPAGKSNLALHSCKCFSTKKREGPSDPIRPRVSPP